MEQKDKLITKHLFVCTNLRDAGKESCGMKASDALREELKLEAKKQFGSRVRVNKSGCLGFCERGICMVVYPEGKWLLDVKSEDKDQILALLEEPCK